MPKRMGKQAIRKAIYQKLSKQDLEVIRKIEAKDEPVAVAYKDGTNEMRYFMDWIECANFFKVTPMTAMVKACQTDNNWTGKLIGETWFLVSTKQKIKDVIDRSEGRVCVV